MKVVNKHLKTAFICLMIAGVTGTGCYYLDPELQATVIVFGTLLAFFCVMYRHSTRDEDFTKNLFLAAGGGITIISWFIGSFLNNRAEVVRTKRELKIKYLIAAYNRIENTLTREDETPVDQYIFWKYSENAIGQVGLFGDTNLVRIANKFAMGDGKGGRNADEILKELRNELRHELGLIPLPNDYPVTHFRTKVNLKYRKIDSMTSDQQINFILKLNDLEELKLK